MRIFLLPRLYCRRGGDGARYVHVKNRALFGRWLWVEVVDLGILAIGKGQPFFDWPENFRQTNK